MNEALLWVNKNASSRTLSRSSKAETARIRAHVQHLKIRSRAKQKVVSRSESVSPPLKKEDASTESEERALVQPPSSSPPPKVRLPLFANHLTWLPSSTNEEKRAFLFFLRRTAQEWSGWRDVSFWCRLVPQASNNHDAIFHSAAALGALHELLEIDEKSSDRAALQQLSIRQTSKAALAANKGPISYTVALMSCIIMVCLQNLQSNPVAFQMLRTGANLVNDIDERIKAGTLTLSRSELSLMNDFLKPILERLGTRYCFLVDLPSAFALHISTKLRRDEVVCPSSDLPEKFNTLLEARNALERIANWAVISGTAWTEEAGLFCNNLPEILIRLRKWTQLLDDVPSSSLDHPGLQSSKILLKAAGLVVEILFDTLGLADETVYDKHLDKFAEIVQIYDKVSQISRQRRRQKISFGIDTGILHTLAFVVGRCRDPKIRRAALELLERDDHMEGDMRASTGSNILRRLVELEEAGQIITRQEDIPESRRVRIWEDHQWWHHGIVKVFFVRTPYEPDKGAVFQEEWTPMPVRFSREEEAIRAPKERGLPNVVFGRGVAAFLDESSNTYHTITLSSFYLPIPRM